MADLYKVKRELLKQKRELRKAAMGRDSSESSGQRIYNEATLTRKALKTEFFGDKSKKSGTKGDDTKIEKVVINLLEELGIEFKIQKALRYLNYDVFIPSCNLYIEVQGEYHHCDERIYLNGPKNDLQRRGVEQTKKKREIAESRSVNLVELWGPDIEKYFDIVKPELIKLIETLKQEKENKYRFYSSADWTKDVFDPKGF